MNKEDVAEYFIKNSGGRWLPVAYNEDTDCYYMVESTSSEREPETCIVKSSELELCPLHVVPNQVLKINFVNNYTESKLNYSFYPEENKLVVQAFGPDFSAGLTWGNISIEDAEKAIVFWKAILEHKIKS